MVRLFGIETEARVQDLNLGAVMEDWEARRLPKKAGVKLRGDLGGTIWQSMTLA